MNDDKFEGYKKAKKKLIIIIIKLKSKQSNKNGRSEIAEFIKHDEINYLEHNSHSSHTRDNLINIKEEGLHENDTCSIT
jgi:hypothetical protein